MSQRQLDIECRYIYHDCENDMLCEFIANRLPLPLRVSLPSLLAWLDADVTRDEPRRELETREME